jgi:hypothetical protein
VPSAAVYDALYTTFASYPLRERIDGCPCCVGADDQLAIHRGPLRKLAAEDLGRYAFKAMTTWGDDADYRHFLPRILELAASEHGWPGLEPWLVASKLDYAKFASWPEAEREPVRAWARELWSEQLDDIDRLGGLLSLAAALEPVVAVDDLLAIWSTRTSLAAALQIARALQEVTSLGRRHERARFERWLLDPARRALLEHRFAAEIASRHADDLAYAIDLWDLLAPTG